MLYSKSPYLSLEIFQSRIPQLNTIKAVWPCKITLAVPGPMKKGSNETVY